MFARYFLELPLGVPEVERVLFTSPMTWLPDIATLATDRGDRLLAEVGFGERVRLATHVSIKIGEPIRLAAKTILPISWNAQGPERFFPSLDADIEVAALTPSTTQLSMSARYIPPLGAMGRAVDRALLHRVAEATLKDFLDRVGVTMMAESTRAEGA